MKLPALRPKVVIRLLLRAGFSVDRQAGSHVILMNNAGHRVTVPNHTRDLKRATLTSIIKQSGLSEVDFLALRYRYRSRGFCQAASSAGDCT